MTNIAKRMIKQDSDRLLANLHISLDVVSRQISALDLRQTNIENNLRQINDNLSSSKVQTLYLSQDEVLTKTFTDMKMYLNPNDLAVAAHIALDGIWEREITQAWMSVIQPSFTVLDIGANFGYYGLLAGQFTDKKKAKIV